MFLSSSNKCPSALESLKVNVWNPSWNSQNISQCNGGRNCLNNLKLHSNNGIWKLQNRLSLLSIPISWKSNFWWGSQTKKIELKKLLLKGCSLFIISEPKLYPKNLWFIVIIYWLNVDNCDIYWELPRTTTCLQYEYEYRI